MLLRWSSNAGRMADYIDEEKGPPTLCLLNAPSFKFLTAVEAAGDRLRGVAAIFAVIIIGLK